MTENKAPATFVVYEEDPLVHMDIVDLLARGFCNWPLIVVDVLENLPEKLAAISGHKIIVTSANLKDIVSIAVKNADHTKNTAAVLISEGMGAVGCHPVPLTLVPLPFKSEHLLDAVTRALESLLERPS